MSERPPSRLEALQKRCEDAQPGFLNACDPQHAAEARALRGALLRTDLPDLARDFRTVAEALRALGRAPISYDVFRNIEQVYRDASAIVDGWLGVPE